MSSFSHWTPRYVAGRLAVMLYERRCPDHPWLTRAANTLLSSCLRESDVGLEFGSGRGTLWLARHLAHLTSVEHDPAWYGKVSAWLRGSGTRNVTYLLREREDQDGYDGRESRYADVFREFAPESLDFVLVDGIYRGPCAHRALERLAPGGILVLDNAQWYLPCGSRTPGARQPAQGPPSADWAAFLSGVRGWRRIWTSNGVMDTVLFFKPCGAPRGAA